MDPGLRYDDGRGDDAPHAIVCSFESSSSSALESAQLVEATEEALPAVRQAAGDDEEAETRLASAPRPEDSSEGEEPLGRQWAEAERSLAALTVTLRALVAQPLLGDSASNQVASRLEAQTAAAAAASGAAWEPREGALSLGSPPPQPVTDSQLEPALVPATVVGMAGGGLPVVVGAEELERASRAAEQAATHLSQLREEVQR